MEPLTISAISRVFTPSSPVSERDLFRGRQNQLKRIIDAIPSPGSHPIVYGLRGVGKTSLVSVLPMFIDEYTTRVTCSASDTFKPIWVRALQRLPYRYTRRLAGFAGAEARQESSLADFIDRSNGVGPPEVAAALAQFDGPCVVILDEFDRVEDAATRRMMADLMKNLSDNSPAVTLVIVGVGQSIRDLIGEHPSVVRNLVQIEMPVMTADEIKDVVSAGCKQLRIMTDPTVPDAIADLADGFPHYAHLLGQSLAKVCVTKQTRAVSRSMFDEMVCPLAVEDATASFADEFNLATKTTTASRFPRLLCACGHAATDSDGWFRTSDVVKAMADVFHEAVTSHNIKNAMSKFCRPERGEMLAQRKIGAVHYYRFNNPMLRPYLRIKGKSLTDPDAPRPPVTFSPNRPG